jgi:hypothetical protein
MRPYKQILGLIVAIPALLAVPSAAAASGKLCSTAGTGSACGAGHGAVYVGRLAANAETSSSTLFRFTNSTGGIIAATTCGSSVLEGEVTNGATGAIDLTKLAFSNCTSPLCGGVSVSSSASTASPWHSTATLTTTPNGVLDISAPTITLVCVATCKWSAASLQAQVTGGEGATVKIESTLPKEEGSEAVCGQKLDFSASYNLNTPTSLFLE